MWRDETRSVRITLGVSRRLVEDPPRNSRGCNFGSFGVPVRKVRERVRARESGGRRKRATRARLRVVSVCRCANTSGNAPNTALRRIYSF